MSEILTPGCSIHEKTYVSRVQDMIYNTSDSGWLSRFPDTERVATTRVLYTDMTSEL
jgi:hypothetical protein